MKTKGNTVSMRILTTDDVRQIVQAEILRYDPRRAKESVGADYPPIRER